MFSFRSQIQISDKLLKQWFFVHCLIIVFLLYLRDVAEIKISNWLFIALATIVFILYDINYTAVFICFLIPLLRGLPYNYIFGIGFMIFMIKNLNKIVFNKYLIPLLFIFVIELFSFIYGHFSIMNFLRFAFPLLLMSLIIFNDKDCLDYKKILVYFIFGAVAVELSIIIQTINISSLDNLLSFSARLGRNLIGETRLVYNPNAFGVLCIFSISLLLVLLKKYKRYKMLIMTIVFFQIIAGSMSLSRTFLVLLAVMIFVVLLSLAKLTGDFVKSITLMGLICIGTYMTLYHYFPNLFEKYQTRLAVEDVSNGRIDILNDYFRILEQHPERIFLGVGLQEYPIKYGMYQSCHNGIQEILINWGIIGIFFAVWYMYNIYKFGWRGVLIKKQNIIYQLPLLVLLISIQAGQFFYSGNKVMYFLPIYACMRIAAISEPND